MGGRGARGEMTTMGQLGKAKGLPPTEPDHSGGCWAGAGAAVLRVALPQVLPNPEALRGLYARLPESALARIC